MCKGHKTCRTYSAIIHLLQGILSTYVCAGSLSLFLVFPVVAYKDYKLICQHNKLSPSSPSWNVSVCPCSLLLFLWPTVNTKMYAVYMFFRCSSHSVLLLSECSGDENCVSFLTWGENKCCWIFRLLLLFFFIMLLMAFTVIGEHIYTQGENVFLSNLTQDYVDAENTLISIKLHRYSAVNMKRVCITTLDICLSPLTSLPLTNEPISNYTSNQASMATQHENTIWGGKIYTASLLIAVLFLHLFEK